MSGWFGPLEVAVMAAAGALVASPGPAVAATLFITADFQSRTTGSWGAGAPHPQPPSVVEDTGPAGPGDHHLAVFASGVPGPGGRLATFSEGADWTGDFSAAGIVAISADFRNIGGGTLTVRAAVDGPGGRFVSAETLVLPTPSLWTPATFPLTVASLLPAGGLGTGDPADTLAAVGQLRFIHNPDPSFLGVAAPAALAIDNITLVPEPSALALLAAGGAMLYAAGRRRLPPEPV